MKEIAVNCGAGAAAGLSAVFIGYPLDTLKVRMQCSDAKISMSSCAKDLFAEQGFKGFFRGLSTPATLATPVTSLAFTGKTLARAVFFPRGIEKGAYGQVSTCAAFGGLLATAISCPGERIKCVLQVNSHLRRPRDALFFLTRNYGFMGLYKGWTFTALRDVPGYTAFFLSYRYLRDELDEKIGFIPSICVAGGVCGCLYWTAGFPGDVLKSRYQTDLSGQYRSLGECARATLSGGVQSVYRGFTPTVLRAFPSNIVAMLVYEYVKLRFL